MRNIWKLSGCAMLAGTCTAAIAREKIASIAPSSRPPVDGTIQGLSHYKDSLWSDLSQWIATIHTDVPVFILTTVIIVLTAPLTYFTWRLWWVEKRKLSPSVSLRVWKVEEFDAGIVVGAYRAQGTTEYLPISRDEHIARALEERSDLLISGRPGLGKSHAAIHALQSVYPKWLLIYPPRGIVRHANEIRLKRKRYILLLDDLDEFTQVEDKPSGQGVIDLIRSLRAQAKELIVVATIRSTLPEAGAITDNLKSLARWAQVELADWSDEQGRKLAQMACVDLKSWDHTPLSVKRPSQEVINRCRRCSVEARVVARALKLCRDCGLGPVRREVLRAVYVSPFFAGESENFESAVSEISNIGFLKEASSHVAAYDLYLDQLSERQFSPLDATVIADILAANAWTEELIDLADNRAAQGELEFATGAYRRALEISPKNPNVHYGLGVVSGRQGAWDTAEKYFVRAAKLAPSWVSPWLRLSVALRKLGKDKEAKKAMARARALDKKGDEIHRQFAIAKILEDDGRVEEAVDVYKTILAGAPQSSWGWWLLGKALNQIGRSSEAKAAHERAVELSPCWASPYFGLAESLQALDDLQGAEKAVKRALELGPGLYDAHVTLGHILTARKQFGEAETHLRESISRFPNAARLHSYLGSILNRCRRNVEAEREFRTAIQLKADYEQALVGLAMALRVQGKLDEAIESNKAAININPGSAEAYFGLAMCHLQAGNLREAVDNFHTAIEHSDRYPEAHYFLAKALRTQGALTEAIDELTLAERRGYSLAKVSYEKAKIFCRLQYLPDALVSLKKAKQHGFRFTEALSLNPVFAPLVPLQEFKTLYEQSPIIASTT